MLWKSVRGPFGPAERGADAGEGCRLSGGETERGRAPYVWVLREGREGEFPAFFMNDRVVEDNDVERLQPGHLCRGLRDGFSVGRGSF